MENARDVAKQTMALVLAGGRGSRLKAMTTLAQNLQFILAVNIESSTSPYLTV